MSKWTDRLKTYDVSPCDKTDKTDRTPEKIPEVRPYVASVTSVTKRVTDLLLFMDDIEAKHITLQRESSGTYRNRTEAIAMAYEICRADWLNRRKNAEQV